MADEHDEKLKKQYKIQKGTTCEPDTRAIPCQNRWFKRKFGLALPRYSEKTAKSAGQEHGAGAPRRMYTAEFFRQQGLTKKQIQSQKGVDALWFHPKRDRKPELGAYNWNFMVDHSRSPALRRPSRAEARAIALEFAINKDPKLRARISAWAKRIKCKSEKWCIGPEVRKGSVQGNPDTRERLILDDWVFAEGRKSDGIVIIGACIVLEFKCRLVELKRCTPAEPPEPPRPPIEFHERESEDDDPLGVGPNFWGFYEYGMNTCGDIGWRDFSAFDTLPPPPVTRDHHTHSGSTEIREFREQCSCGGQCADCQPLIEAANASRWGLVQSGSLVDPFWTTAFVYDGLREWTNRPRSMIRTQDA